MTQQSEKSASTKKSEMSFIEILNDEDSRELVDAIEWGSSDPQIIEDLKTDLFEMTGWIWIS